MFGWGLVDSGKNFKYGVGGCSVAPKDGLRRGGAILRSVRFVLETGL